MKAFDIDFKLDCKIEADYGLMFYHLTQYLRSFKCPFYMAHSLSR